MFNAILALQNKSEELKNPHIVVYSGSEKPKDKIFELVKERFGINANAKLVHFIKLESHTKMEP